MNVCTYVCMYLCVYVCKHLCVCMHVSFVCMYIYIASNYFGFNMVPVHTFYMYTCVHVCKGECIQTFRCLFLIVHTHVFKICSNLYTSLSKHVHMSEYICE